jgi:hypothetical protein
MNWEILEKVVRFKGRLAHTDIIIERKDEQSPFIYAIVDEPRDKAIILHAMCDSIEEAKTMALGSLQAYEAITQNSEQTTLFVIEDQVLHVSVRTEYGDKYEPIGLSGDIHKQLHEIVSTASLMLSNLTTGHVIDNRSHKSLTSK